MKFQLISRLSISREGGGGGEQEALVKPKYRANIPRLSLWGFKIDAVGGGETTLLRGSVIHPPSSRVTPRTAANPR